MHTTRTRTHTRSLGLAVPLAAGLALTLVLVAGCGNEPAEAPDSSAASAVDADDAAAATPPLTESELDYRRIVATIDATGAEGAQAAWDDDHGVFLVFAASW